MGCDIHINVEVQQEDSTWREIPYQIVWQGRMPKYADRPIAPEGFDNRNYNLFAILANVRNGRGFAGIKTGEGWPSIAANRGLPQNSPSKNSGDHSFTWVLLDELKSFDWDATKTNLFGVVHADVYENLADGERPENYSGDVSGYGVHVYSPGEYQFSKRAGNLAMNPYVRVTWTSTAREATYDWPDRVIPWLEELAHGRPLRLILGFDS